MLNKNALKRLELVATAMEGVVKVTMRRQHGQPYTFMATLLPNSQECAKLNNEQYYRDKGTTASKARRERSKRKQLLDEKLTWHEQLDRSINLFYVVDADECRWRAVSLRQLIDFEPVVYIGR
jgi:hypothetical protein